jgi:malate dehydrogenase
MEVEYCAVPVEIGKDGIEKIHPLPKFNDLETATWKTMIPILQKNIETGVHFVKGATGDKTETK